MNYIKGIPELEDPNKELLLVSPLHSNMIFIDSQHSKLITVNLLTKIKHIFDFKGWQYTQTTSANQYLVFEWKNEKIQKVKLFDVDELNFKEIENKAFNEVFRVDNKLIFIDDFGFVMGENQILDNQEVGDNVNAIMVGQKVIIIGESFIKIFNTQNQKIEMMENNFNFENITSWVSLKDKVYLVLDYSQLVILDQNIGLKQLIEGSNINLYQQSISVFEKDQFTQKILYEKENFIHFVGEERKFERFVKGIDLDQIFIEIVEIQKNQLNAMGYILKKFHEEIKTLETELTFDPEETEKGKDSLGEKYNVKILSDNFEDIWREIFLLGNFQLLKKQISSPYFQDHSILFNQILKQGKWSLLEEKKMKETLQLILLKQIEVLIRNREEAGNNSFFEQDLQLIRKIDFSLKNIDKNHLKNLMENIETDDNKLWYSLKDCQSADQIIIWYLIQGFPENLETEDFSMDQIMAQNQNLEKIKKFTIVSPELQQSAISLYLMLQQANQQKFRGLKNYNVESVPQKNQVNIIEKLDLNQDQSSLLRFSKNLTEEQKTQIIKNMIERENYQTAYDFSLSENFGFQKILEIFKKQEKLFQIFQINLTVEDEKISHQKFHELPNYQKFECLVKQGRYKEAKKYYSNDGDAKLELYNKLINQD